MSTHFTKIGPRKNGEEVGMSHHNQKQQTVMAVTDVLALFWQYQHN